MNTHSEVIELHRNAWSDYSKYTEYLEKAISLCEVEYEAGERSLLFINNYAALLLDLHRDAEALRLLKDQTPEFSEYCSNYAIAIAKSGYDIEAIRKWNRAASNYPKRENAIVAYMDWQAL
ncbi:hypothetical protein [Microbulbifer sp. ALW1]|uniref:hypothetical protein n=1 Tax=Microbulbifer sp. (strain ALW1) TaxID=1516059 RepID=UPI001358C01F|nr:hypothetical protein [Microbulbifer sp. ALW1]